jgi:heme exporter protein D
MSIIEFFSQGGYAFFVWSSYGMAAVLLLAEIIHLRGRRRTISARIGRFMRMRAEVADNESQT